MDAFPGHVRQRVRQLVTSLTQEPRPKEAKELRDLPGYRVKPYLATARLSTSFTSASYSIPSPRAAITMSL